MFDEFIENAFLNEEAGACAAYLALVEEDAFACAVDSLLQVCVVEYDVGRFAAQFEGDWNQLVACSLVYAAADFSGAGECEFVDIRMIEQPLAGFGTLAGDNVQNALREDTLDQTDEFHQGQGCMGGRFNNDGVACCQCRSEFPASHGEREVPRNDLTNNADWFMENQGQSVVVEHGGRTFPSSQASCEVTEMIGTQRNICCCGFTDRLAVVQCFHQCEMIEVCVDDISDLQKNVLSFDWRSLGPFRKGCSCRFHCFVHVFFGCFCEISQVLAICRIVGVKGSAVRGGNEFAINEETVLFLNVCFCHNNTFLSITCGDYPLYEMLR